MDYVFPQCLDEDHHKCGMKKDDHNCTCACHEKKDKPLWNKKHKFWMCYIKKCHLCETTTDDGAECTCPCHRGS